MKRLDRAMYAIFLLALLADVAWSPVPAVAAPDSTRGLMLSAASQLRPGQVFGANPVRVRRRSHRLAGLTASSVRTSSYRLTISRWAKNILDRSNLDSSSLVMLAVPLFAPDTDASSASIQRHLASPSSPSIFEHSGSPAP
jgi:hypothetical protein